jgi:hypothetical protein
MWTFSKLSDEQMNAITKLETKLGRTLIAYSDDGTSFSDLDGSAMKEVEALENKMGVSLIAVDA